MKSNFYEKIIPIENEQKRLLINKMSTLLDESLDAFINLRQRQINEQDDLKLKMLKEYKELISSQRIDESNNNNNIIRLRERIALNHAERIRRIMNMEEENDDLDRQIEADNNIEIIG